ncbi:MAG: L-rhamnose/proton symporter RhaT [Kiritimatiellia bacterium]|jgi:L-rhamnose-H+ transport protein|nr:L-rhamnose/proton symporter RhaT [Kiritimatiellia bacterium]
MITANPLLGTVLHAVGATSAAVCYTPQKRVKGWSWQTYWLTQAVFCWLLLPLLGAWLTIPQLAQVLSEAPRDAMLRSFLLGAAYGVGGTAFGLAIRHIGFSLTYALAVGLSSVLGTLLPPLARGEFAALFAKTGAAWVMAGIAVGTVGIFLCGLSGRLKEIDLTDDFARSDFCLAKGLPLCLLAGVLSAVYGFALEAGAPIARVAEAHGAGHFNGNVTYIFANSGAFLTTLAYCLWLSFRHASFGEWVRLPAGTEKASLAKNLGLAVLTGCLWYGQFFFYNLGHVRMGTFRFTSWAIHMILLVLISNALGLVLREWRGCRPRTWLALGVSLATLISSVLFLTYGNYLGGQAAGH